MSSSIEKIIQEFTKYVTEKGFIIMNSKHSDLIRQMIAAIFNAKEGQVTVIPAMMGLGKSTLIRTFCKYMAINEEDFGAIVVKERLTDIDKFANEIGDIDDDYPELEIAYSWNGYNEQNCSKGYQKYEPLQCYRCEEKDCDVKLARINQYYHPVVAITHERLFLKTNANSTLTDLKTWENNYKIKQKRGFLFIDERPKFFDTDEIKYSDIGDFISALRKIESQSRTDLSSLKLQNKINTLFSTIEKQTATFIYDEEALEILKQAGKQWFLLYEGSKPDYLKIFTSLFNGYVYNNGASLTVSHKTDFAFEGYATVIFDGTAQGDKTYPSSVNMVPIEDFRTYSDVTLYHCERFNLSKRYLENLKSENKLEYFLKDIASEIRKISETGKTLVVCHQRFESDIRTALAGIENIQIGHFNALKGSNDYVTCKNVFFAGTIDFGDAHYVLKALAVDEEQVTSYNTLNVDKRHSFECDFINEIERNDKEKYTLQDIFRVAIRNIDNKEPINIYLFQTDKELVDAIAGNMKGCKVKQWYPEYYHKKYAPTEVKVVEYLKEKLVNIGDYITKKQLEQDTGISVDMRKEIFNRNRIKDLLSDNGIESKGQRLTKIR